MGIVALVVEEYGYRHWWLKIEGDSALDRWEAFWASQVDEARWSGLEAMASGPGSQLEELSAEQYADILECGAYTHEAHIHEEDDSWMRANDGEGAPNPGRRVCCPAAG